MRRKGLEWPSRVLAPNLFAHIPEQPSKPWDPIPSCLQKSYDPSIYTGGDDGERRLWYVALTRLALNS